jgi:hypothetical protein
MKLDIGDEQIPLLIRALEHYYAYTRAVQREDSRYQQAADWLQSKLGEKPATVARATRVLRVARRRRP